MLKIIQIPVLSDNYIYLLRDETSGKVAVVDPAIDQPVEAELGKRDWGLDYILNTHHHWDHTGANLKLKEKFGAIVIGPKKDKDRIPGIDHTVADGDKFQFGDTTATIFEVPGHTSGHIAYYFDSDKALFCGDTLFAMGCGRLFEGTPEQMVTSLDKFLALPDETRVYCAHEYTAANGAFALSIEPDNTALQNRMKDVAARRQENLPTIPTTIGLEKATNPFLRTHSQELQKSVGLKGQDRIKIFAETRRLKDNF